MAVYTVQLVSWGMAGMLAVLGLVTVGYSWRHWSAARRNLELPWRERRYLRWRSGLRMSAGVLLVLCGGVLAYLGTTPLHHLEGLFQAVTKDPDQARALSTAENQSQLQQTLVWVAVLGLCACLLVAVALAELTITWIYGWHKRWELHQAQQAYLAQQAAQAQRVEPIEPHPPPVPQKD